MRTRGALLALVVVSLVTGLAACGGGSSSSTSSSSPGGLSAAERTASTPNRSPAPAGSAPTTAGSTSSGAGGSPAPLNSGSSDRAAPSGGEADVKGSRSPGGSGAVGGARGAAAFLVPQGDNSIPTYGSEASPSEQTAATAPLAAYLNARASGDWGRACAYMGAQVQRQVEVLVAESNACPSAYAKLSSSVPAAERASPLSGGIAAFRVEGDKAFALFYGPNEQQYMMPMVNEGGAWKVNQIEAIPWPIGSTTGGE